MRYHPDIHHRQSIRYRGHDYSLPGTYFITTCTHRRESLFGHIVAGQMHLNDAGRMVQSVWDDLEIFYPNISTDEFIIMPDHIHGIIHVGAPLAAPLNPAPLNPSGHTLQNIHRATNIINGNAMQLHSPKTGAASSAPTIGIIVRRFKSCSAIAVNRLLGRAERPLWQRNYWERIIRTNVELQATRQYIRNNPKRWQN